MRDDVKKFEAQIRKVRRMIAALATVELFDGVSARVEAEPAGKAINRAHSLANACCYEPGADARFAEIRVLHAAFAFARDELGIRISDYRSMRIRELEIERARAANARPY